MNLISKMIHPDLTSTEGNVFKRQAARGIVLRDESILLLFTERYNDFSFPGGGVDPDEDIVAALARELNEETGARDVRVKHHYGYIEELRPYWKPEFDLMHMTSHFFVCDIAPELEAAKMEHYEIDNGMKPVWVKLHDALRHNREVMKRQDKSMGQSIQRETFMLDRVATEFLAVGA
ncbi:NUDIX hydrolase [Saccharospirillum sp.]|uniref:NUDIX hydrolase n=1 Tax=Saccharospirillum sp. TaxID=2033801 RepID=UPI00349FFE07